jgi:hypothetical protein
MIPFRISLIRQNKIKYDTESRDVCRHQWQQNVNNSYYLFVFQPVADDDNVHMDSNIDLHRERSRFSDPEIYRNE